MGRGREPVARATLVGRERVVERRRCRGRSPRRAAPRPAAARISVASPGRSRAAAISSASCSAISSRRASSRGSSSSSASAARFARQRSTAPAIVARSASWPAERVEQVALPALVEQPLLLVLAVDLDEGPGDVREARRGHRLVVEAGRRPAGRGHLADGDQRLRDAGRTAPSTRATSAPWRISVVSARAPVARPSASIRRLLPAPVSPVKTFSPGASSRRRRSISARSVTVSSRSGRRWRSLAPSRSRRQQLDLAPEQVPERQRAGRLDEADRAARAPGPRRRRRRRSAGPRGRRC